MNSLGALITPPELRKLRLVVILFMYSGVAKPLAHSEHWVGQCSYSWVTVAWVTFTKILHTRHAIDQTRLCTVFVAAHVATHAYPSCWRIPFCGSAHQIHNSAVTPKSVNVYKDTLHVGGRIFQKIIFLHVCKFYYNISIVSYFV